MLEWLKHLRFRHFKASDIPCNPSEEQKALLQEAERVLRIPVRWKDLEFYLQEKARVDAEVAQLRQLGKSGIVRAKGWWRYPNGEPRQPWNIFHYVYPPHATQLTDKEEQWLANQILGRD